MFTHGPQSEARVNLRLGALDNGIQRQVLLWRSEIHLSRIRPHATVPGKDLDLYVRRFHERGLDYCSVVVEGTLVDICLDHMANKYCVNL